MQVAQSEAATTEIAVEHLGKMASSENPASPPSSGCRKCSLAFILTHDDDEHQNSSSSDDDSEDQERAFQDAQGHRTSAAPQDIRMPFENQQTQFAAYYEALYHQQQHQMALLSLSSSLQLPLEPPIPPQFNPLWAETSHRRKNSKFCAVPGCKSRAKHSRRCWKHGGSVKCKVPACSNRAKSKGVCWSHGGGTICSRRDCLTISVSNSVCWAHGGGNLCSVHYAETIV
uniref:WRKY19-like zinc finger domain-containing protein n=1 Tax=Globisporangium ultimum (strain ATCC 200006 / CBS 805.95 / DAOM BR144) TaxID=431595 RepID=K3X9I5_GLOUD